MEYIQQEINIHKTKLITLINNLINTQLINEEISISLLTMKSKKKVNA